MFLFKTNGSSYNVRMKIRHLLFDLDNTLYPSSSEMDRGITRRMLECVAEFFNVSPDEAVRLRAERITHYSTTLEWLRAEGLTDVEKFLAHVHPENEADELPPQEGLRNFLISLDYPKSILTNAPREHADRVLAKLGIGDLFSAVCDIRDCGFLGKPYPQAYTTALSKTGAEIGTTLFLDDMTKYTDGWAALGGTAVLVGNKNGRKLSGDAEAVKRGGNPEKGKTLRLDSIYGLPGLIAELDSEC